MKPPKREEKKNESKERNPSESRGRQRHPAAIILMIGVSLDREPACSSLLLILTCAFHLLWCSMSMTRGSRVRRSLTCQWGYGCPAPSDGLGGQVAGPCAQPKPSGSHLSATSSNQICPPTPIWIGVAAGVRASFLDSGECCRCRSGG